MPNSSAAVVVSDDTSSGGSNGLKKGPWTAAEDAILMEYVKRYGEGNWNAVQKNSGLSRCGKSCRLRWANHLRPNLKKGSFSPEEERLILELHAKLGNKWARMAAQLPGRTDNEIKNYWNTRVKRRQRVGLPLYPQDIQNNQSSPFHHHQSPQSSFMTPMSVSDPISFSNNSPLLGRHNNSPLLSSPILGFKRFRRGTPTLPLSSSLYTNNFSSQFLPAQNFQFDTNNYNFGLPTMLQSGFDPSGLFGPGSAFSVKMELPSSQMSQPGADADTHDSSKFCSSLACTNSGLLDALLQEAEAMGGKDQARQQGLMQSHNEKCGAIDEFLNNTQLSTAKPALGSASQWDEASSAQSSAGGEIKTEPTLNVISNHVDDDELSSLLSSIPTTTMVSELYNEGANALNGDDAVEHHLPSISAAAANSYMNNELAALCAWNNLPGMSC